MQHKIICENSSGVALIGGGRLEQLGFAETIRAEFEGRGFHVIKMDDDGDVSKCSKSALQPTYDKQIAVVIIDSSETSDIARARIQVEGLSPRAVILALRDPDLVLRPAEWPSNLRGVVKWDEISERASTFLTIVSEGLTVFDPKLINWEMAANFSGPVGFSPEFSTLTRREGEIASEICRGSINREIAAKLGITVNTVNTHVNSLIRKLGVSNRTEVAVWYLSAER